MYSSNLFCSRRWFSFWKSHSFVYWMKLLKTPFVWFDLPITQLCSWNESKHAAVVQGCRLPLSLTMAEMTWSLSHAKRTIKSPNATQNVVRPTPKVPSYAEYQKVLCLHDKWCGNSRMNPFQWEGGCRQKSERKWQEAVATSNLRPLIHT